MGIGFRNKAKNPNQAEVEFAQNLKTHFDSQTIPGEEARPIGFDSHSVGKIATGGALYEELSRHDLYLIWRKTDRSAGTLFPVRVTEADTDG
jgi:hypothetical protein